DRIRTSLAGRAAEVVYYGETDGISTGASGDLQSATSLAEQMICVYGMDEDIGLSTINIRESDSLYYSKIRDKINKILSVEFEKAKKAISDNINAMNNLVKVLMEKNHLKSNEIEKIFSGNLNS
ncbi:MAG: cell division protein FtsH, partial [Clostridia bacterium]|nr:cell division protein FtsH [Clostridia bacterium]